MSDNAALDPIRAASNENLISELISESYHYGATDEDPYDYPPITDRQDELLRRLAVPADQVAVVGDNDWQNYELVEELAIAIAEEDWDNLVGFHQDHLKTQVRGLLYEANERGYRMTRADQTNAAALADQVAVSRACADRAEDWAYESRVYGPKGTWEAIDDKLLQELRAALAADQTDAGDE